VPGPRLAVCAHISGPEILEIRCVTHAAENSTEGLSGNPESVFDIFSSEGEWPRAFFYGY